MLKVYINNDILKSLKNDCKNLCSDVIGVYFLKLNGKIVYVGQSKNVRGRILSHLSIRQKAFDSFDIYECSSDELIAKEKHYIKKYNPFYNVLFSESEQIANSDFLIRNDINFSMDMFDIASLHATIETLSNNSINCELYFNITNIKDKPSIDDLIFCELKKETIPVEIIVASRYSGVNKKTLFRWSKERGSLNYQRYLEILTNTTKELNDKANKMIEGAKQ